MRVGVPKSRTETREKEAEERRGVAEDKRAYELPSTPRGRPGQALGGT